MTRVADEPATPRLTPRSQSCAPLFRLRDCAVSTAAPVPDPPRSSKPRPVSPVFQRASRLASPDWALSGPVVSVVPVSGLPKKFSVAP